MPHASASSTMDLPAGNYVALCFIPDSAGVPHVMHGMMKEIVVAGARHDAAVPTADAVIRMSDFAFVAPVMTAGAHTFHVVNDGPQTHEVQLVRLPEGVTADQYLAALAPGATAPPPGEDLGGAGALSTGLDNYWTVTLTPGNYLLGCFVPDTDGVPHIMKGMLQAFTVTAG